MAKSTSSGKKNTSVAVYPLSMRWMHWILARMGLFQTIFLFMWLGERAGRDSAPPIKPWIIYVHHPTPMELALESGIYGENRPASSGVRNSPAFPGSPPTGETTNSTSVGSVGLPALLFPCLITKKCPPTAGPCAAAWELACFDGPPAITPVLRFYHNFPEECFTRITVRLNWPEIFKFYYTFHWKTGVQMHNPDYNVIVRLSLDKSIDEDCFVRFEVRALPLVQPCAAERTEDVSGREKPTPGETNVDIDQNSQLLLNKTGSNNSEEANEDQKEKRKRKGKPRWHGWPISEESLWDLIIPVLKEIESVLCAYPGLCYKRMLECPNCKELTFSGEWLTPQEIQTTRYRKCPACVYKLASCLIAPPERGKEYMKKAKRTRREKKSERRRKNRG